MGKPQLIGQKTFESIKPQKLNFDSFKKKEKVRNDCGF